MVRACPAADLLDMETTVGRCVPTPLWLQFAAAPGARRGAVGRVEFRDAGEPASLDVGVAARLRDDGAQVVSVVDDEVATLGPAEPALDAQLDPPFPRPAHGQSVDMAST